MENWLNNESNRKIFDDIEKKIKILAKATFWCGIGVSVICGIVLIVIGSNSWRLESLIGVGIAAIILGSLLSWVGSLITYGFGELLANVQKLADKAQGENTYSFDELHAVNHSSDNPFVKKEGCF